MVVTDEEKYDYNALIIERGYAKAHVLSHVYFKYIVILEILVFLATMLVPMVMIGKGVIDPDPIYSKSLLEMLIADNEQYIYTRYVWMLVGIFATQFFVSISAFAFIRKKPIELLTLVNIAGLVAIVYLTVTNINFMATPEFLKDKGIVENATGQVQMNAGFSYFVLGPILFGATSVLLGLTLLFAKKVIDKKEEGFKNFNIIKVLTEKDLMRLEKHDLKIIAKYKSNVLVFKHELERLENSIKMCEPGTSDEKKYIDRANALKVSIAKERLKLKPFLEEMEQLKQVENKYRKEKEEIRAKRLKEEEIENAKKIKKEITNDMFSDE